MQVAWIASLLTISINLKYLLMLQSNHFPPQKLTEAEISDPYLVIQELFDFDHLPGIRELLW